MSASSSFVSKRRRQAIYRRDYGRCVWCTSQCAPQHLTLDHIVPRSHGGTHRTSNLVTACLSCNSRRGNLSLLAFAGIIAARQFTARGMVVVRVLQAAETPILAHSSKRDARRQRGQLSMVLR